MSSRQRTLFVVYTEPNSLASRPALDFSKGVRGKHLNRMQQGTNIVLIAPDVIDTFPDFESVNEALRSLKKIATRSTKPAQRRVVSTWDLSIPTVLLLQSQASVGIRAKARTAPSKVNKPAMPQNVRIPKTGSPRK